MVQVDPQSVLPQALQPFVDFATELRANGFVVSPDQTQTFIEATGILGPRSMRDIHRAARATLAPTVDQHAIFDALFRKVFLGQILSAPASNDDDDSDELQAFDDSADDNDPLLADDINEVGEQATRAEALTARSFTRQSESDALRRFRRQAAAALPRRHTLRYRPSKSGKRWDMRRILQDAVRRDGEVIEIPRLARSTRQRPVLLLVDVSGSMKTETDSYLRFAHTLARVSDRLEVFTLGTRLTRVTRATRLRQVDQALDTASAMVSDWDGGTRLGDALDVFLRIPRFRSFSRGALVMVLSDGLERGDASALIESVKSLSRLAWHLAWMTPLAADERFVPKTDALQAISPYLDGLANGHGAASLCDYVMSVQQRARINYRKSA